MIPTAPFLRGPRRITKSTPRPESIMPSRFVLARSLAGRRTLAYLLAIGLAPHAASRACAASAAPPRTTPTAPHRIEAPRPTPPLIVADGQYHDPESHLPSWLVQLTIEPDPTARGARRGLATIDAVLKSVRGVERVTQRYTHALVGFAACMSPHDAAILKADPRVRRVEPDLVVHAAGTGERDDDGYVVDPDADGIWGLRRISAPDGLAPAFDPCGADGSGVTVVVIDSGITEDHTEFEGRIVAAVNFNPTVPDVSDEAGHGTHVAGTIAGRTVGVAPAADIVALRVFGPDNSGPTSAIVAALNWMASPFNLQGPAVANMSLGGPFLGTDSNIYFDALQTVQSRGIPIIAAAGNYSYPARWSMPATSADTICVGATGILDRPAVFSDNGPTVDLWAPGVNILSADARHPDGGLKVDSGTSMAAPMTTGVAALHLQRFPPDPTTQVPGGHGFDTIRRQLALIASSASGRLTDWTDPRVVAVGANGGLAGAANRLLQACPSDDAAACDDPIDWLGDAASIVLGDGIDPLPAGFTCSRIIAHPSSPIELTIQAPAILPIPVTDGPITSVAADVVITDLTSDQVVWVASSSWFAQSGFNRTTARRLIAGGLAGFRVDWISYRDDLVGGYGYAMTATRSNLEFRPANAGEAGVIGATELGQILAAWGPCSPNAPCPTDLDGDGVTGSSDLGLLLTVWGEVPVLVRPGFGIDCGGNPLPLAWLGDAFLDTGSRSFVLDPASLQPQVVTVDLDCARLHWDAPETGTGISSSDPRLGAASGVADCDERPLGNADARFFWGHGTDCSQPSPTVDAWAWCSTGTAVGDISASADGADWSYTLVRQPVPGGLHAIDQLRVVGDLRLRAPSNSNVQPTQYQRLSPSFEGDLRVTVSFDDGSTASVIRTPRMSGIAAGATVIEDLKNLIVEDVHADDGRAIAAVCLTAAGDAPGLSMDRLLGLMTTTIAENDPAPGAEYSPDNGRTWYPLLTADGRRLQVLLCIDGE